jgi:hypothetical protein
MPRLRPRFRAIFTSLWTALALIAIALATAVISNATLLYDGAWFLFRVVDLQRIEVPQLRITFGVLQWPLLQATRLTDSFAFLRIIYSIPIVIAPLVSMAISWWIIRKDAPHLIVWPALGVLLVDLPGQMHWIATSIRTNQLFWPILLAILIGMPDRALPVASILYILILFLHPQVSVYLMAGAMAAVVIGWRRPDIRARMLNLALVSAFGALFRASVLQSAYEAEEASVANQFAQWERSVLGLPAVALVLVALSAVAIALRPRLDRPDRVLASVPLGGLVVAGVLMTVWGSDAATWRNAIDYRGPSMWHSLPLMGLAFLDATVPVAHGRMRAGLPLRRAVTNLAALVFCVVISVQSWAWRGELDLLRDAMAHSTTACIGTSVIPGFETSPVNFWTLPPASIMLQDRSPDFVVLPDDLCTRAREDGVIPMSLVNPHADTIGRNIDLLHLRGRIATDTACMAQFGERWHALERSGGDYRRWNDGNGDVLVHMDEEGVVVLRGTLDSLPLPNEVKILVNGQVQRVLVFEEDRYQPLDGIELRLQEGVNTIEILSMRPPMNADSDERELATAVINLEFSRKEDGSLCTWTNQ